MTPDPPHALFNTQSLQRDALHPAKMPQKPLKSNKKIEKKQPAANRHGKTAKMKKGEVWFLV
jgi:hypothetical protein